MVALEILIDIIIPVDSCRTNNLTTFMRRLSTNSESLDLLEPLRNCPGLQWDSRDEFQDENDADGVGCDRHRYSYALNVNVALFTP